MARILFIANLDNPSQVQKDRATAHAQGKEMPIFPIGSREYFWTKILQKQGHTVSVFWRNNPDFESQSSEATQSGGQSGGIVAAVFGRLNSNDPSLDADNVNQLLRQRARDFKPDILWIVEDNRIIDVDTLTRIKDKIGSRIIYVSGRSPIVFAHRIERQAAHLYDLVVVNDYYHGMQWRELGARDMVCLPLGAIDPEFHFPRQVSADERKLYAAYVTFIGTLTPSKRYTERIAVLSAMREFNIAIWSDDELPMALRPNRRGAAYGERAMRVMASSGVTINVHGDSMRYGGHERLFEAAGIGAFMITDDRPCNAVWFTEGVNLVVYRSLEDLHDKILYYLNHADERNKIVAAARRHVLNNHTYEHRLRKLQSHMQNW